MNMQRRFGMLTAVAGAALALGSLTFAGSATATESTNHHDHDGNITTCPAGTTQFNGQATTGSGSTALFHWAVTSNMYVTVTQIDPTVTGLTAYVKGGDHYRVYSPVISGQAMRSPTNNGGNVPALSHWMLCYTVTPRVTTTTALVTTTTELVTTTTVPDIVTTTTAPEIVTTTTVPDIVTTTTAPEIVTTTTVPDIVTTTTIGESEGPTTTAADTTTTDQASEGPTTTVDDTSLPTTGGGGSLPLMLGLSMSLGGVLLTLLARNPRES